MTARDPRWLDEPAGRRRGPECLSDLALDRLERGEIATDRAEPARRHLEACEACGARATALRHEAQEFVAARNLGQLAAEALARAASGAPVAERARRRWRRLVPLTALLGAGVAIVAFFVFRTPQSPSGEIPGFEQTRTMGSPFTLGLYVKHPDRADQPTRYMGEDLHPTDRLRFTYRGDRSGYLVIVAVDASQKVSVYYPSGPQAARVDPGAEVQLATAVELDATLGTEQILAVRCDAPVQVADVLAAARAAMAGAVGRGAAPTDLPPLALPCTESRVEIRKAAAPPAAR